MYAENLAKMSLPTSKDSLYLGLRCGYLEKDTHVSAGRDGIGMQQHQFLACRAQGWYWRMQGMFRWLWENHDDVNYCSYHPVSCVFHPGCLPGDSLRAETPVWGHQWQWSPRAELCLQAVLAQSRGCTLAWRGLRKPEVPMTSSGSQVFSLLTCPRVCCKGRPIQGRR